MASIILYILKALLTTGMVIGIAYVCGNLLLPLFNIRISIRIKLYKAPKAL